MALPDQPPDPHGILGWITAVLETVKQAYVALILPAVGGVAFFIKRRDARLVAAQKRADDRQDKEEEAHQKIADQLDRDSAERFERMKAEIAELRREREALHAEVSRLLALVQRWYKVAHAMWHEGHNRIQVLSSLLERGGLPVPAGMALPDVSFDPDKP